MIRSGVCLALLCVLHRAADDRVTESYPKKGLPAFLPDHRPKTYSCNGPPLGPLQRPTPWTASWVLLRFPGAPALPGRARFKQGFLGCGYLGGFVQNSPRQPHLQNVVYFYHCMGVRMSEKG